MTIESRVQTGCDTPQGGSRHHLWGKLANMDPEMVAVLGSLNRKRENLYSRRQRIDSALKEIDEAERSIRSMMALLPEGQNLPIRVERVVSVLRTKPKWRWTASEVTETLLESGQWATSTKNPEYVVRAALSTAVKIGLVDGDTRTGFTLADLM